MELLKKSNITYFFFLSVIFAGLFHDYTACISSIVLSVFICIYCIKNKSLNIYINPISIAAAVIVFFYGISVIWALDRGMAPFGFVKNLPLLLFLVMLMQSKESAAEIKFCLPYFSAFITVVTSVLAQIPMLKRFFSVDGRLSGTFQYPNTFALLLLVSLIIALTKEKVKIPDIVCSAVLLFGILYSGSRIVFVFTLLSALALIFIAKDKKIKLILPIGSVLALAGVGLYVLISGGAGIFERFLTPFTQSSTLNGRILYTLDMLPVVLRHPFGMGYMGYFYFQQSVQTGVYSVMYVHNELLQFMLDIGWIPSLLFYGAVVRVILKKHTPSYERLILGVILLHSLLDFDFQFLSVMFLVIIFCDFQSGKNITLKNVKSIVLCSVLSVISLYFGIVSILYYANRSEQCHALYPFHTQNEVSRLIIASDVRQTEKISSDIVSRNKYVAVAYDALAKISYSKGDFSKVIEYKNRIFEIAPFDSEQYAEYCTMLMQGISLYNQAGDKSSAQVCRKELVAAREKLNSLNDRLSFFAKRIDEQPTTVLPDVINEYIDSLSG